MALESSIIAAKKKDMRYVFEKKKSENIVEDTLVAEVTKVPEKPVEDLPQMKMKDSEEKNRSDTFLLPTYKEGINQKSIVQHEKINVQKTSDFTWLPVSVTVIFVLLFCTYFYKIIKKKKIDSFDFYEIDFADVMECRREKEDRFLSDYIIPIKDDNSFDIIIAHLQKSQKNSISSMPMIPLCVPYVDKDKVRELGARWCPVERSWFYPFNADRTLIDSWLPKFYKSTKTNPIISIRLVPEPLWELNPRSALPKGTWDLLRRRTYERFGKRCCICGCRGDKWAVECDEIWSYKIMNEKSAMACFEGLQALCPPCHQVHHFGKARVDGKEDLAYARLMYLNSWSQDQTDDHITFSFDEWEDLSVYYDWYLNMDILAEEYGVEFPETDDIKRVG